MNQVNQVKRWTVEQLKLKCMDRAERADWVAEWMLVVIVLTLMYPFESRYQTRAVVGCDAVLRTEG